VAAAAAVVIIAAGLIWTFLVCAPCKPTGIEPEKLSFVGSETCISCHSKEGKLWHTSQHAHAMAHATGDTVLGDFDDATFDYYGVKSRFFKKDGKFFVETDGPDGKLAPFEVKFTFGVYPLQQYLVEFPDGRIQALSLAWDARPKSQGGQRWFHLYPNEKIDHNDPLHWTKLNQNWNFMCAECHSTGVHKNYDAKTGRFATTWTEINIGCEDCHGQGSAHVAWAKNQKSWWPFGKDDHAKGLLARFDERSGVTWSRDPKTNQPQRSVHPAVLRKEVEVCGRCHARRGQISEDWVPGHSLSDTHEVAMLTQGLYQADGQMLDEVYNYGSFKQSKMFAHGVTCSDCHDPHSAKLRLSGNQVCLQCHASTYAQAAHTHHEGVSPAPTCVACHMPARTYMVVDRRHDHSFRVPRPDLSAKLGVSNACNDCHTDKSPEWAAAAIENWFGPKRKGFQTYADAFHAAWTDQPDAARLLAAVAADGQVPSFARASALAELAAYPSASTLNLVRKGLADPDPMVRIAALDDLETVPPAQLWPLVSPLLTDPVRGVRIKAAFLLGGMPSQDLSAGDRERLAQAEQEFIAAQHLNADRPEARAALGRFYARQGDGGAAESEYRAALRLAPFFAPAAVNLADLYRQVGRDADGVAVLREAIKVSPQDAGLHHALGLALARLKRMDEAIEELRRAAELEPDRARYAYVYAVGLDSLGRRGDAIKVLEANVAKHPADRNSLLALVNFSRAEGDPATALKYAEQLAKLEPANQDVAKLVETLRSEVSAQTRQ
jgi:predicted CXXCH cytochrome family protein